MSRQSGDLGGEARQRVDAVLREAVRRHASDVHLEPTTAGYDVRLRIDGLLETREQVTPETGRGMVNRLMVAAELLTYRMDIPQEGRATVALPEGAEQGVAALDLRVSVMPTNHGQRAVVRLPAELVQPRRLEDLALPERVVAGLRAFASADQGLLLLCGPAGSGKTTTVYALLRHIVQSSPGLSVVALEDPVERDVPGVTQIEVTPFGELTYERALRSMLRQDPQVLAVGEVRDAATASIVVQAALSGHRVVSTLHAGTPEGAMLRLLEMGVEPYQVASAVSGVVAMRLLRRRSPDGEGYAGRIPVAEYAALDSALRARLIERVDPAAMREAITAQSGFRSLREAAAQLIDQGMTDEAEVHRVLGGETPG